jgi:hypothetical protein
MVINKEVLRQATTANGKLRGWKSGTGIKRLVKLLFYLLKQVVIFSA